MANNKVSLLIPYQFPAFVQDDYPKFVRFLQAYYEFLEQSGNLNDVSSSLEDAIDIDNTLPAFLDHFAAKYASFIPNNVMADKVLLLKNARQFYTNKGTESSLRFLFRALFNEEIDVYYPNRNILRVSDGKWHVIRSFRFTGGLINTFKGDGVNRVFRLTDSPNISDITVTINGALFPSANYTIFTNILTFGIGQAPGNGDNVKVTINTANYLNLINKNVTGTITGASALITSFSVVYDRGIYYNELKITDLNKNFQLNEEAYTLLNDATDITKPQIIASILITSVVVQVTVIEGGTGYNIGDPATIKDGGGAGATAVVSETTKGGLSSIIVNSIGAGYLPANNYFVVTGGGSPTRQANVILTGADTSGNVHPATYSFCGDIVANLANQILSGTWNMRFPNVNANSVIANSCNLVTYGPCGPIDASKVIIVDAGEGYTTTPVIFLPTPLVTVNTSTFPITTFGIMGSMYLLAQGAGYSVGDEVVFTNVVPVSLGRDAAGAVTSITANGGISRIEFQAPRISGTVNVFTTNANVIGSGTNFTADLRIGESIQVNNEIKVIANINSATLLYTSAAFAANASNKKLGSYAKGFIGGAGYTMNTLPNIMVSSLAGTGASIVPLAIIGAGAVVIAGQLQKLGAIIKIDVTSPGRNYINIPTIDLTKSGDGSATAAAQVAGGIFSYPGVFNNEDGMPSSVTKLQDRDFYQFFSYVIKSSKTLDMYERALTDIIHPLGMRYFAEYVAPLLNINNNAQMKFANTGTSNSISISTY